MKNKILICFVFLLLILFIISGCKKAEVGTEPVTKEEIKGSETSKVSEIPGEVLNGMFDALEEGLS